MTVQALLDTKRNEIKSVAASHGATNVRVFGSAARGEANDTSDVDFLVDMERGRSLLDMVRLKRELETLLGVEVDLVTEKGLYWLLRRRILKDARPL